MNPADCLKTRPKSVALMGLGTSHSALVEQVCGLGCKLPWEEVWAVNFGISVFRHDKLWVMDDLREQAARLPEYGDLLRRHDKPIITSASYPEYPMSVDYPLQEVVDKLGDDFLNSTVAYAVAWAMVTGVKELWLFGCDFHYPNQTRAEEGGQCCAYLLGLSRHFGMTFRIPPTTTLLGAYHAKPVQNEDKTWSLRRPLYGYAKQPYIPQEVLDASAGSPQAAAGGSPQVAEDSRHDRPVPGDGDAPGPAVHQRGGVDLDSGRESLLRWRAGGAEPARVGDGRTGETHAGAPAVAGDEAPRRIVSLDEAR